MSDPVRVAAAVEGPTDEIVLEAILKCIMGSVEFDLQILQPERSSAFGSVSPSRTGLGRGGVYRWCRQSAEEGGGSVSGSWVLSVFDLLIVHVDADVAGVTYASAGIRGVPRQNLPCNRPCPPPRATTNALRAVILGWLGVPRCPNKVVLCTPSMNMDAWVIATVLPNNSQVTRGNWECHSNPAGQLRALSRARRFRKCKRDYQAKQPDMTNGWSNVSRTLSEANRFERELRAAVQAGWTCAPGRSLGALTMSSRVSSAQGGVREGAWIRRARWSKSSRHFRRIAGRLRAASSPSRMRPLPRPSATPRSCASAAK